MTVAWGTPAARRVLAASVLGSSMAFLDATVVNVALPQIGRRLHTGLAGLQWVVDAYLVGLSALVLLGGALGDRFGRSRVFTWGVAGFALSSLVAGRAPGIGVLLAGRAAQGVAAALMVPNSLALLTGSIDPAQRAQAVGMWSGLTGVAGAAGPMVGGWLVDAFSWRWVFVINLPVALAVIWIARGLDARSAPEETTAGPRAPGPPLDIAGSVLVAAGLALVTAGIIGRVRGWPAAELGAGVALLAAFGVVEWRSAAPMLPLRLFSSLQFTGVNAVTVAVYAGLGAATFLVVVDLQRALGYSAFEAGTAMVPVTVLLLLLSERMGALSQRIGPRIPMTIGPLVAAAGLAMLAGLRPGDHYAAAVLPGVCVFGLGLSLTVAPLTAVVMAAVDDVHLGLASGVNNAAARLASLVGVAAIPAAAGLSLDARVGSGLPGYRAAMLGSAALCLAGGLLAAATIRTARAVVPSAQPSILEPCHDPARLDAGG